MTGQDDDIIAELKHDHREVEELFARYSKAVPGSDERSRIVDEVTVELVRHSVAEEQYLYPAIRRHVPGGDALADRETEDHAKVEKALKDMEKRPDDADLDERVEALRTMVEEHVHDEENNLFPRLRATCTYEDLDELGVKIRSAKKNAPTHPHPHAPSTPPANKLLAPGVGLVDRARDYVTGRSR